MTYRGCAIAHVLAHWVAESTRVVFHCKDPESVLLEREMIWDSKAAFKCLGAL